MPSEDPTSVPAISTARPRMRLVAIVAGSLFMACAALVYLAVPSAGDDPLPTTSGASAPEARLEMNGPESELRTTTSNGVEDTNGDPGARTADPGSGNERGTSDVSLEAWGALRRDVLTLTDLRYPRDMRVTDEQCAGIRAALAEYRPLIEESSQRRLRRRSELHDRLVAEGRVEVYESSAAIPPAGRGEMLTKGFFDHPAAGTPGEPEYVVTRVRIAEDDLLYQADRDLQATQEGLAEVIQLIVGRPSASPRR